MASRMPWRSLQRRGWTFYGFLNLCEKSVRAPDEGRVGTQQVKSTVVDIYLGCLFSIAIMSSSNPNESFLTNTPTSAQIPVVAPKWNPPQLMIITDPDVLINSITASPLYPTPQFHLATLPSPATLYCTDQQLWWQCFESPLKSETYPLGSSLNIETHQILEPKLLLSEPPSTSEPFGQILASIWVSVITSYSDIARESEGRVEVIDGIAARLRDVLPKFLPGHVV
jgi:hypothetical protein